MMNFNKFFRCRVGYSKIIKILIFFLILYNFFYVWSSYYNYNLNMELKNANISMEKLQNNLMNIVEHGVKMRNDFMNVMNDESDSITLPESGIVLKDGITIEARRFIKELNLTNPGDQGRGVVLDEKLLTAEHRKLIKEKFDEFGSNVFASNLISLNRQVSDNRSEHCKKKVYSEDLPKVSVVIAFYNEPWSVLMRLVHSVMINTPEHLLNEIVLSDDYSDKEHLKEPLEEYLKTLKKVKLVRSHTRLGVVGARVLGFRNAKGPVMVSLDSHMEVAVGWLEPMLDRLKDNPTLLTWSSSINIHKKTFKIMYKDSTASLAGVNFG